MDCTVCSNELIGQHVKTERVAIGRTPRHPSGLKTGSGSIHHVSLLDFIR